LFYIILLRGRHTHVCCLSYKQAFDCINHKFLLRNFKNPVIRGVSSNLFKSFLNDRTHNVKCDDFSSESHNVFCGGPQGTVLNPLLFIIFINNLLKLKINSNFRNTKLC